MLVHYAQAGVQEHVLANGMKIIVKEDRRAPVVVCMVWYRAGSMDEVNGTTGVAHVLEHMMFKGTQDCRPANFPGPSPAPAGATTRSPAKTAPAITNSCTNPSSRSRSGWKPTAWRI